MPVTPTYPGVYVDEIPSGNFTITGVATSITAFVGRAVMGPINDPQICFSYADFVNAFGGRSYDYPLSYAVEDFFMNGGGEAIIVRVVAAPPVAATTTASSTSTTSSSASSTSTASTSDSTASSTSTASSSDSTASSTSTASSSDSTASTTSTASSTASTASSSTSSGAAGGTPAAIPPAAAATLTKGSLAFLAANKGAWGNSLSLIVDTTGITQALVDKNKTSLANCFNLTLVYTKPDSTVTSEYYPLLTIDNTPKRIDRVLNQQSNLAAMPTFPATGAAAPAVTAIDSTTKLPKADKFAGGADGGTLVPTDLIGDPGARTGLYALDHTDLFNLLCIPWDVRGTDVDNTVHVAASEYCVTRRAMYIVDGREDWVDAAKKGAFDTILPTDHGITTEATQRNTITYFPKVKKADLEMGGLIDVFPACGIVAGQIATTDATRGVWKAPAGIAAGLGGITDLQFGLTDPQQGLLNPLGINCLRNFRVLGPLVWGARTLRGADLMSDDYKYVPVRRLALYIEESLYRGTKFAVFEPNDETLWSALRLTIGTFMADLARQGAFYSYSVTCDKTTTTQSDIDQGRCNVLIAFAPVKPAEFIVLQFTQKTAAAA